jgi:hypothetical protein
LLASLTSPGAERPVQVILLRWRHGLEVVEVMADEDTCTEWVHRLADEDRRLLRAVILEPRELEGDCDWGGPSLFVKDIICFHGYADYPAYWYKAQVKADEPMVEPAAKPTKKAKKK